MRSHEELLRHAGFVRGLARKLAGEAGDDVAQQVMLSALEKPPRHERNVRGWLARIVKNVTLMERRAARRRVVRERSTQSPRVTAPTDEAVGRLELHELLVKETLALEEPYRTALVLRYFDGLAPREIASKLDLPRRTVTTRLYRGLERLRGRLDRRCGSRTAWAPALLALALPREAAAAGGGIWKGAAVMAGKLSFAAGGFVIGAMTTFAVTEATRPDGSPRVPVRRANAERTTTAAKPEAGEQPASAEDAMAELSPEDRAEAFLRRINAATDLGQLHPIAAEMLKLEPKESRELLFGIYDRIHTGKKRMYLTYIFSIHPDYPYVLDVLDRSIRDGNLDTRTWALRQLKIYALIDFEEMPDAYRGWREQTKGLSRRDALLLSGREFVERLRTLQGKALQKELRIFRDPPPGASMLKDIDLLDVMTEILKIPVPEDEHGSTGAVRMMQRNAWRWITSLHPDETYLKEVVLPYARQHRNPKLGENPSHALQLLAGSRKPWVFDELVTMFYEDEKRGFGLGGIFATYGDKRAIPHLIAAIAADPKYETIYGLGYYGLTGLTGVTYDESHDGDWWLDWWDRNKDGLPAEVRAIDPHTLR